MADLNDGPTPEMAGAGRTPYRLFWKVTAALLLAAGLTAGLWDGVGRRIRSAAREEVRDTFLAYLDALREASPTEVSLDQAVLAHVIAAKLEGEGEDEGWFVDASTSTSASHAAFLSSLRNLDNLQIPSWLDHESPPVCRLAGLTDISSLRGLQGRLTQVRVCGGALVEQGLLEDSQDLTRRLDGPGKTTAPAPASAEDTSFANFVEPLSPAMLPKRMLAVTEVEPQTHLYEGGVARSWLGFDPLRCPKSARKDPRGCQGAEIAWRTWGGAVRRQTVQHPPGLIFWKRVGLGLDGTAFLLGSCRPGWKESAGTPAESSWCLRAITPEGEVRDTSLPRSEGDSLEAAFGGADAGAASPLAEAFGQAPPRRIQSAPPFPGSAVERLEDQYWIGDQEKYGVAFFDRELLILATRRGSVVSGTAVPLAPRNVEESSELWRHPSLQNVLAIVSKGAVRTEAGPAWVLFSLDRGQTWQGEALPAQR